MLLRILLWVSLTIFTREGLAATHLNGTFDNSTATSASASSTTTETLASTTGALASSAISHSDDKLQNHTTISPTTTTLTSLNIYPANATITSPATLPTLLTTYINGNKTVTECPHPTFGVDGVDEIRDATCCSYYNTKLNKDAFYSWLETNEPFPSEGFGAHFYYWPGVGRLTSCPYSFSTGTWTRTFSDGPTTETWTNTLYTYVDTAVGCDRSPPSLVTAVIDGYTMTSPTSYVHIQSYYPYNFCGTRSFGGVDDHWAPAPMDLSTLVSYVTTSWSKGWQGLTDDLTQTRGVYAPMNFTEYEACAPSCHPIISVGVDHLGMGAYHACDNHFYGYFDPPVALTKVPNLLGSPEPTVKPPATGGKPAPPTVPLQTGNAKAGKEDPQNYPHRGNQDGGKKDPAGPIQTGSTNAGKDDPDQDPNRGNQSPDNKHPDGSGIVETVPQQANNSPTDSPDSHGSPGNSQAQHPPAPAPAPTPAPAGQSHPQQNAPPKNPLPPITVGGQTYTPNAAGQYNIGSQTLLVGGPTITVGNTPIAIAPGAGAVFVGSSTWMLDPNPADAVPAAGAPPNPVTPTTGAILTLNGQTLTANGNGAYTNPSQTLIPGGPPVTVDGTLYSLPVSSTAPVPVATGAGPSGSRPTDGATFATTSASTGLGSLIMQGFGVSGENTESSSYSTTDTATTAPHSVTRGETISRDRDSSKTGTQQSQAGPQMTQQSEGTGEKIWVGDGRFSFLAMATILAISTTFII